MRPAITVMYAGSWFWHSRLHCDLQCRERQLGIDMSTDSLADHLPTARIKDHGDVCEPRRRDAVRSERLARRAGIGIGHPRRSADPRRFAT